MIRRNREGNKTDNQQDEELCKNAEDAKRTGYLTLTEEYFVSKCANPTPATKGKITKRLLDITDKFDYSKVHPTIRAQVALFQV